MRFQECTSLPIVEDLEQTMEKPSNPESKSNKFAPANDTANNNWLSFEHVFEKCKNNTIFGIFAGNWYAGVSPNRDFLGYINPKNPDQNPKIQ